MPLSDGLMEKITNQSSFVGSVQVLMDAIKNAVTQNPGSNGDRHQEMVRALSTDNQALAAALLANTPYAPPIIPG